MSMVFDRVWHAGLLYKLQSYGITGRIFGYIQLFLPNCEMKVVLNRLASFHTNAGVPQGSILGPTQFLIFINDFPDVISSQLDIYADGTTIYACLSIKSNKVNLAAALVKDLQSVVNCSKKWPVKKKKKMFSFDHHREPFLPTTSMADAKLQESNTLHLLSLTFSTDMKWSNYIESITMSTARKVVLLSCHKILLIKVHLALIR